jgi:DNA-binding transcriptional regulator YiaG
MSPQNQPTFAKSCGAVEQVRWAFGLSRKQLATLAHIDESSFAKWLAGMHRPTEKSLRRIVSFLAQAATQGFNPDKAAQWQQQ